MGKASSSNTDSQQILLFLSTFNQNIVLHLNGMLEKEKNADSASMDINNNTVPQYKNAILSPQHSDKNSLSEHDDEKTLTQNNEHIERDEGKDEESNHTNLASEGKENSLL